METKITLSELIKPGNVAVVTGASSGIGRAACLRFAQSGMTVWMVDVDEAELGLAHQLVQQSQSAAAVGSDGNSTQIHARVVDVADEIAVQELATAVFARNGATHILMNNAGIGLGGGALTDMTTVQRVLNVNTYGPIHGCVAFVPKMKASDQPGMVINTGSKQGITMPPGNLTYNISKAALKAYTEGLEHEFMQERMEGVGKLRAALLVPGWVNTSILLKAQQHKASQQGQDFAVSSVSFHEEKPASGAWMPSQVIDFAIQEIDADRFYVICPDNDVDRETDNMRMTWTMQDVTHNRPPLSRWHPAYKDKFTEYVKAASENRKSQA
jgi:NAD(P)-dependent dehydrogenase (short-subunit alcohol dehydrogenase family)